VLCIRIPSFEGKETFLGQEDEKRRKEKADILLGGGEKGREGVGERLLQFHFFTRKEEKGKTWKGLSQREGKRLPLLGIFTGKRKKRKGRKGAIISAAGRKGVSGRARKKEKEARMNDHRCPRLGEGKGEKRKKGSACGLEKKTGLKEILRGGRRGKFNIFEPPSEERGKLRRFSGGRRGGVGTVASGRKGGGGRKVLLSLSNLREGGEGKRRGVNSLQKFRRGGKKRGESLLSREKRRE